MQQFKYNSPLGPLFLVANPKGLCGVYFDQQSFEVVKSLSQQNESHQVVLKAVAQLTEYFNGERQSFDLPIDVKGTGFQKQVWTALTKIPYGKTKSYREIALEIKNPKAFRAVGTANGKNPLGIIVPCHRVIAADGTLGGYAGGLDKKKHLLELERGI